MSKEFAKKWLLGVAIFVGSCLLFWCMTLGFETIGIWLLLAMMGVFIICVLILIVYGLGYAIATTIKAVATLLRDGSN